MPPREKSLYSEFFWSVFSRFRTRKTPNTDTFYPVFTLRENNFLMNNITRSLNILGLNKINVSYCLLSSSLALLSISHFQRKIYLYIQKYELYIRINRFYFENRFWKVKPKY